MTADGSRSVARRNPRVRWAARAVPAAFVSLVLAVGCTPARSAEQACTLFPRVGQEPAYADLTDAVPFRGYLALTHVGPFANHYIVSSAERRWPLLAVWYDATGAIQLSAGGDLAQDPHLATGESPDITRALERELARRCASARFDVKFAGAFRRLRAESFTPTDLRPGTKRAGWTSSFEILADRALENTVPVSHHHSNVSIGSGWGRIEIPVTARWVQSELERKHAVAAGVGANFVGPLLAAARSSDAGTPGPRLADVLVAEPERLLVSGSDALVHLLVNFHFQSARGSRPGRAMLPLEVRDAVFGSEATAETEVSEGASTYTVRARLVPERALVPEPGRVQRYYRGALTLRILDAQGVAFERSYPTSGTFITKGNEAASTYAFMIPGGTYPSTEYELIRGKLRSPVGEDVGFSIDTQMKARAPR